jgi:ATP-dependent helicase/nuclease subunit B
MRVSLSHPLPTIGSVTLTVAAVPPSEILGELSRAIAAAKGGDRLAPVTVVVPTNTCGVMARRALGRRDGLVGVDMVTLGRLAELIAGPGLAAAGRSPMSSTVVELAIASILHRRPGSFAAVATHPSTVVALRELHDELRTAGPGSHERLAASSARGREVTRVSAAVTHRLESNWYDEGDLLAHATQSVRRSSAIDRDGSTRRVAPSGLIVYLPQGLPGLAVDFVQALSTVIDVHVVSMHIGDAAADVDATRLLDALAPLRDRHLGNDESSNTELEPSSISIVSTTDADDEVRIATRAVLDAARSGTPFERIAVLWPTHQPYARLVEHHLTSADIPWNGRPGTSVAERLAPRLVLDLLDVDRRGLRRRALFSLMADVAPRAADGSFLPTASWERVSREAGVARDDDWAVRLAPLVATDRWGEAAGSLIGFVSELRGALGPPGRARRWEHWAAWCTEQLESWVGRSRLDHLPEVEFRAWESLAQVLDRLGHLDPVGEPVTRHRFRTALAAELDALPGRVGRVGAGVTVGSLAGASGLDVDVVIVLGACEGSLPPRPSSDPLISDADRAAAGLDLAEFRTVRMHHVLVGLAHTSAVTFTVPRGDLRSTSHNEPSRWLDRWASVANTRTVSSNTAGLVTTAFPATSGEHRLRTRYVHVSSGGSLDTAPGVADDLVLTRGLALLDGRSADVLSVFDGDLSTAGVASLDQIVSPTQLEAWTACPHAYFMRYMLGIKAVEEPDDQISITALDRGTTHHEALDRFHRAVIAGELPQPAGHGWSAVHRDALMRYFDDECARAQRRGRTGRRAHWSDEQERMRADLLGWLDHDSRCSIDRGSTVLASEHRFGRTDPVGIDIGGRIIQLHGSIDRVDQTADGSIVVTDHKSGSADKYRKLGPDDPTLSGAVFQLPAYAVAARSLLGRPDADVRTEYGLMGKGRYERPGYTLTPEVEAVVVAEVRRVVSGIESGYFPNRPERPGWRMFVSCRYCEPDLLGTTERWGEWSRKRRDPRLAQWFGPSPNDVHDQPVIERSERATR